jgi:chitinase
MIGGNDTQGETFTLADVGIVASYAKQKGIAGVHFWSFDRDNDCTQTWASPTCNSYGQAGRLGFTTQFLSALGL